jgi:hypothetical protein
MIVLSTAGKRIYKKVPFPFGHSPLGKGKELLLRIEKRTVKDV